MLVMVINCLRLFAYHFVVAMAMVVMHGHTHYYQASLCNSD